MDGVHAVHNAIAGYGWIPKGEESGYLTNTGRNRVNVNGAYTPDGQEVIFRTDDSINGQSTVELLKATSKKPFLEFGAEAVCSSGYALFRCVPRSAVVHTCLRYTPD